MRIAAVLLGFAALYLLLDRTAAQLQSFRGEWGALIVLLVIGAALVIEWLIARRAVLAIAGDLGLRGSKPAALAVAIGLSLILALVLPIYGLITGRSIHLIDGWPLLAIGIFAQAGIAEETIFRGFLFRHFRRGRSFWRAAVLGAIPFVAVHLVLFWTMEPIVAAMALLVSVSLTFPFAWIYEQAGNSIWPPAILHAVVQGTIKVIDTGDGPHMAIVWMLISAIVPWTVFLLLRKPAESGAKPS
jgi:membrane protease YdiL (CAAX protease family)